MRHSQPEENSHNPPAAPSGYCWLRQWHDLAVPVVYRNPQIYRKILLLGGIALIPLIIIVGIRLSLDIKIPDMTRDVTAIGNLHPLSGFLSSLGILAWWTSASIWLFTAFIRKKINSRASIGFQLYSGLLSLYIALDDLFQIHEHLAPNYLKTPEYIVYTLLLIATGYYLWHYRYIFTESHGELLAISIIFLVSSVLVDALLESLLLWLVKNWSYLIEDGLKWLGICFWTGFCIAWNAKHCKALLSPNELNIKN